MSRHDCYIKQGRNVYFQLIANQSTKPDIQFIKYLTKLLKWYKCTKPTFNKTEPFNSEDQLWLRNKSGTVTVL